MKKIEHQDDTKSKKIKKRFKMSIYKKKAPSAKALISNKKETKKRAKPPSYKVNEEGYVISGRPHGSMKLEVQDVIAMMYETKGDIIKAAEELGISYGKLLLNYVRRYPAIEDAVEAARHLAQEERTLKALEAMDNLLDANDFRAVKMTLEQDSGRKYGFGPKSGPSVATNIAVQTNIETEEPVDNVKRVKKRFIIPDNGRSRGKPVTEIEVIGDIVDE